MCGRFFIAEEGEDELLALMIEEASRRQQAIIGGGTIARGEVFPAATVAALAVGKTGAVGAYPMQWGYHRHNGKGLIINTRSETALDKPMFRASMLERRCLIPCSWYFEWEAQQGRKIKYAIRPKSSGLMYLAAIYRYEETQKLPVFSVLTRAPSQEIAFIHDRMPVIFSDRTKAEWLNRAAMPSAVLNDCEIEMAFQVA